VNSRTNTCAVVWAVGAAWLATVSAVWAQESWSQWGGPERNFVVPSADLADTWPKDGPPKAWSRDLGEGYSAIAVKGGTLYTMYRQGDREVVVALDAGTGATKWEHGYDAPVGDTYEKRFGLGPNATPLVSDGRVYTMGFTAKLHCLDAKSGEVIWKLDPVAEFGVEPPGFGASASPMQLGDKLYVVLGGKGNGLAALEPDTGKVIWKKHDFENLYSSPVAVNVAGRRQLVLVTSDRVVGIDPETGERLWEHEHVNQWKTNISTPAWLNDGTLYVSSGGDAGARLLKLTHKDGKTVVGELWKTREMQVGQGNAIRVGDYIYGSSGHNATFIGATEADTGKVAWRQRGFKKATMLYADDKLIILDEDGVLALARPGKKELDVRSKFELFDGRSWTVPTLVGKRLYARDNKTIVALDLP